ncbi:MAG: hypothetical protein WCK31_04280, partial [bacterium]
MALNLDQIQKYADLLVNFGLSEGNGIKKGEKVLLTCTNYENPIVNAIKTSVEKAGGMILLDQFLVLSSKEQSEITDPVVLSKYYHEYFFRKISVDHHIQLSGKSISNMPGFSSTPLAKEICEFEYKNFIEEKNNLIRKNKYSYCRAYDTSILNPAYFFLDKNNPTEEFQIRKNNLNEICMKFLEKAEKIHVYSDKFDLNMLVGINRKWCFMTGHN